MSSIKMFHNYRNTSGRNSPNTSGRNYHNTLGRNYHNTLGRNFPAVIEHAQRTPN